MKRLIAAGMMTLLLVSCWACQPTPEQEYIVSKEEEPAASASQGGSVSQGPVVKEGERWEETFSSRTGDFKIVIDAEIDDQGLEAGGEYEVSLTSFTDEQVARIAEALIGDRKLYEDPMGIENKEAVQERLIYQKSLTSRLETEDDIKLNQQRIEVLESELQNAPSVTEIRKNEITLSELQERDSYSIMIENNSAFFGGFSVTKSSTSSEGQPTIRFKDSKESVMFQYSNEHAQEEPAAGMETTREEAIALAEQAMKDMGMEGYALASCNVSDKFTSYYTLDKGEPEKQCYTMRFARVVDGTPLNEVIQSNGLTESEDGLVRKVQKSETVIINVTDEGIQHFYWGNPLQIEKVSDSRSSLLDFEEIKEQCRKFLMAANTDIINGIVTEVHIDKIQLGWMIVPKKDSQDTLRLVPVWDFYGYNMVENNGKEAKEEAIGYSQLTINALDGSVINRIRGY